MPLVLTEIDSHLGLTNRLLAPFARRVCLAFPIDGPRRPQVRRSPAARCRRARTDRGGCAGGASASGRTRRCVLVFGGSQGARSINQAAIAGVRRRRASGCSTPPASATSPSLRAPGSALRPARLHRRASATRWSRATWSSARSGGSIFEIAAAGRPAVLIPYPHATADHQTRQRALSGASAGAAVVIPDAELTPARAWRRRSDGCSPTAPRLAAMARGVGSRLRAAATPPRRSPQRCMRRREALADAGRRLVAHRRRVRTAAALRRHRRRRDERPRADRARARARGDRLRPRRDAPT